MFAREGKGHEKLEGRGNGIVGLSRLPRLSWRGRAWAAREEEFVFWGEE